jgi:hypothetical protein
MKKQYKNVCPVCNKEFVATNPIKVYDDDYCKRKTRLQYDRECTRRYQKNNPDKVKLSRYKYLVSVGIEPSKELKAFVKERYGIEYEATN